MLTDKGLAIGIFSSGRKTRTFNLSWNSGTTTITAYTPLQNENDRPRINTFRTDGTYVIFASAGNQVYNPITNTFSTPWGNRSVASLDIDIPLFGSLSAGIDFFTDNRLPVPVFTPTITQWLCAGTGNPNEVKYQYIINRNSARNVPISISF
jgi:hypothetical protein